MLDYKAIRKRLLSSLFLSITSKKSRFDIMILQMSISRCINRNSLTIPIHHHHYFSSEFQAYSVCDTYSL